MTRLNNENMSINNTTREEVARIENHRGYIAKVLNNSTNRVHVQQYDFSRHQYAYKGRYISPQYTKVYIEQYNNAPVSLAAQWKDRPDSVVVTEPVKAAQFHKPIGYVLIDNTVNKSLVSRLQEILAYGHKVYVVTPEYTQSFTSEYSMQSELDEVYYSTQGIKGTEKKQSPFICELPNGSADGTAILNAYRQQHRNHVWNYVFSITDEITQIARDNQSEDIRESRYEREARRINYSNRDMNLILQHKKIDVIKARLSKKARAYGYEINLYEGQGSVEKYSPARDTISNKPVAFGETSSTLWDTEHGVDRAMVTIRQKTKISELPSSNTEIYEAIEAISWFEKHGEEFYLESEDTYKCECGYPASIRDYRCPVCTAHNKHYLVELTTENAAELDLRIEQEWVYDESTTSFKERYEFNNDSRTEYPTRTINTDEVDYV